MMKRKYRLMIVISLIGSLTGLLPAWVTAGEFPAEDVESPFAVFVRIAGVI